MNAPLAWLLAAVVNGEVASSPASLQSSEPELRSTETNGLALTAGLGVQYIGVGIQAAYYFQLPHSLYRIVPYAALGLGWCGSTDGIECSLAAGVMASFGHKHRVFVDLGYGPLAQYRFSFHGEEAMGRALSGPFAALGYEYMSFGGFVLRTELGAGYVLGIPLLRAEERTQLVLTLIGLGYKF